MTETRATFAYDVASFAIVELDALHLGAAQRLGTALTCITFDIRQAQLARALEFRVAGR